METIYNERYKSTAAYWGLKPSSMCYKALELMPAGKPLKVLDLGCGEGQDALFFARNGFEVTAFDLAPVGLEKGRKTGLELGINIQFQLANIAEYEPEEYYDLVFSSGTLQYLPIEKRKPLIDSLKAKTNPGGLHVLHTFVSKPFVAIAPDAESNEVLWTTGEILTYYHDWYVEHFVEEIKDCMSSGVPHRHAHNRLFARKPNNN